MKPKIILFKFTAKDIKQRDITRFRNLINTLGVKCECKSMPKLKGEEYDSVFIDEVDKIELKGGEKDGK